MADEESDFDAEDDEPVEPSAFERFYDKNRRRFQLAALAIFLVAVALEISSAVPREVRVSLRFPSADEVRAASIEYQQGGETVRQVERSFPAGAPSDFRDTLELSPGDYDVDVVLTYVAGPTRAYGGSLTAPADGIVNVALE